MQGKTYNMRAWREECKRTWQDRQYEQKENLIRRARRQGWDAAKRDIDSRHPGETRRAVRNRLKEFTALWVIHIASAYSKMPKEKKETCKSALQEWVQEHERKARDPEYVPKLKETNVSSMEHQFLSEIVTGIDAFFVCRQKTCLWIGRNVDWAHDVAHHPPKMLWSNSATAEAVEP